MTGNLSRHYLKAMGIDSWQLRDALPQSSHCEPDVTQPDVTGIVLAPSAQTHSTQHHKSVQAQSRPIAKWSATSFDESLRDSKVALTNVSEDGQILLALERQLTSPAEDLLAAMLKAIKIDRLSQPTVTFNPSATSDSFNDICVRVKPAIVVVMAMLSDSSVITELDAHRRELHRFSWVDVPVAITLHPQVLLENPEGKRAAWEDLKRVKVFLDG